MGKMASRELKKLKKQNKRLERDVLVGARKVGMAVYDNALLKVLVDKDASKSYRISDFAIMMSKARISAKKRLKKVV